MRFEEVMEVTARCFEAVGVAVIVIGGVIALVAGLKDFRDISSFFVACPA